MSLNLPYLVEPRFTALHPETGRPVSFGRLYLYAAGTNAAKAGYTDRRGSNEAPNPVPLGPDGAATVYLSGPYRIAVHDANDRFLYDADQVNSIPVELEEGNPGSLLISNNLTDLANPAVARQALGLTKQESAGDTTADRVMTTGAFGLGRNEAVAIPTGDANAIAYSGIYDVGPATVGRPAADGVLLHLAKAAERAVQLFARATGSAFGDLRWRERSGDGWSAWLTLWHSGSRRSDAQDDARFVRHDAAAAPAAGNQVFARANIGLGTAAVLNAGTDAGDLPTTAQGDARWLNQDANLADLTNATTARNSLGLGSMATRNAGPGDAEHRTNAQMDGRYHRQGVVLPAAEVPGNVGLGAGQEWRDLTEFRSHSTAYLNNRGRPIVVSIVANGSSSRTIAITNAAGEWVPVGQTGVSGRQNGGGQWVVPPGRSIQIIGPAAIAVWAEMYQ